MNDVLEVVWYSNYINEIGITYTSFSAFEYIDFKDENVVILEVNLIAKFKRTKK